MKAQENRYGDYIVTEGTDRYKETAQAQPTSRLLDRSSDQGYWAEYVGYGTVDGVPVRAIYLLDHDQADIEEESDYDWSTALADGRIVVDVDKLTDAQYDTLRTIGALTIS